MSTDRDVTTRIVRSWLHEDAHEDADRILNLVLDEIDTTPQRRASWLARRFPVMNNNVVRVALVAAAALVVAVIGIQLLGGPNVGGPSTSEEPSRSATAAPTATPAPSDPSVADVWPPRGVLEPGSRYGVTSGGVALSFAVPTTNWTSDGAFSITGPNVTELSFFVSSGTPGIFTDPCAHTGLQQFEASAAGAAEAFASEVGADVVSAPTEVTVDGRVAQFVAISVPVDIGCSNSQYWLQHDPTCGAVVECTFFPHWLGSTIRIWIVDLDEGNRFQIKAESVSDVSSDLEGELQQIIDSIQFE